MSTVADLRIWAAALGKGTLLHPETQAQRIGDGSYVADGLDYAFAIFNAQGWIGHNGDIPGYTTVSVYLPDRDATHGRHALTPTFPSRTSAGPDRDGVSQVKEGAQSPDSRSARR